MPASGSVIPLPMKAEPSTSPSASLHFPWILSTAISHSPPPYPFWEYLNCSSSITEVSISPGAYPDRAQSGATSSALLPERHVPTFDLASDALFRRHGFAELHVVGDTSDELRENRRI